MALKTYRPTTPGLRQLVLVDRGHLWKGAPIKMLTEGKMKEIFAEHVVGGKIAERYALAVGSERVH